MKIRIKKFISLFLVAIIGFSGMGKTYFFDSLGETQDKETRIFSHSDFVPQFDQGLEFSPTNINVPIFKALDTVFDFVNSHSIFSFNNIELSVLKTAWSAKNHRFYSVYLFLFPFHYFW